MIDTVYICAAGRSGSTLLDLLLGAHPDAVSVGELTHLPKNISINSRCTCGSQVSECTFWRQLVNEIGQRMGTDLWKKPYSLDLGFIVASRLIDHAYQNKRRILIGRIIQALVHLEMNLGVRLFYPFTFRYYNSINTIEMVHNEIRRISGAKLVVNSSKSYRYGVSLYMARPDSVRLLLLTRDGRGVLQSRLNGGFDRKKSLLAWKNYYSRALPLIGRHVSPEHVLAVRYEELASNPARVLEEICNFLEIEYTDKILDFRHKQIHILNGNKMRFSRSSEIRLDEKWKTTMRDQDREYFEMNAGSLNRKLGYM